MKVKEIMHEAVKIPSTTAIAEAAIIMDKKLIGSALIIEDDKIVGIITERDILRKIVAKGKDPTNTKVKEIMNYPLITIDANADISEASEMMDKHRIRRLVVKEGDSIIGKITANTLARNIKYILARDSSQYSRPDYK